MKSLKHKNAFKKFQKKFILNSKKTLKDILLHVPHTLISDDDDLKMICKEEFGESQ